MLCHVAYEEVMKEIVHIAKVKWGTYLSALTDEERLIAHRDYKSVIQVMRELQLHRDDIVKRCNERVSSPPPPPDETELKIRERWNRYARYKR